MDDANPMSLNKDPNPEGILEAIKQEEAQRHKGRLKIFLGMAAGVGKTYMMLEEAHALRKEQIDIVVGNIETHGRKEIEILLKNLPQISLKSIFYKDKEFKELDVDSIIGLHPSIVLVDELSHSNIPGSKNAKRWQDVLEILDHGINVHATLNIQHIESLKDIVFSITEIPVNETIPDIIIEKAHSIQLIDLTPDELLQRLKEGKVYIEEQFNIAIGHFFQKNKLAALREIFLRYVSNKVDFDLSRMVITKEGRFEWKTREKFLVAIHHSLHSQKLIRVARHLAAEAKAPWIAVYVDTGKTLSKEDDEQLAKNQVLTRSLGAEIVTIHDPDVAEGIKSVAYQRDITQIILGRTDKNLILSLFQAPTLLDKLSMDCKNIDLHVIRQDKHTASSQRHRSYALWQSKFSDYLTISFLVCLMAAFSWAALLIVGYRIVEFLFLIGICTLSAFFKRGPIILAAILFGLIWSFFFFPPPAVSSFSHSDEVALLVLYVLTALSTGIILTRAGEKKKLLRKGNAKTSQLTEILQYLHSDLPVHNVLISFEEHLPKVVKGTYKFVIKNNKGIVDMDNASVLVKSKERITALWALENDHEAGWSTNTLPASENLYIPLKGAQKVMGLLIYRPTGQRLLTKEERTLIDNLCQQLSNYLEKSVETEEKSTQNSGF